MKKNLRYELKKAFFGIMEYLTSKLGNEKFEICYSRKI